MPLKSSYAIARSCHDCDQWSGVLRVLPHGCLLLWVHRVPAHYGIKILSNLGSVPSPGENEGCPSSPSANIDHIDKLVIVIVGGRVAKESLKTTEFQVVFGCG